MKPELVHASCVALLPGNGFKARPASSGEAAGPVAVLLRGPSGAGKSDLSLRLIDQGARLVADDRTELVLADGALLARAPKAIRGKMEVRGLGIAALRPLRDIPVGLVVDLVAGSSLERLPEPDSCTILDVELPLVRLDPFEASAPAKLRLALAGLDEVVATGLEPDDEPDCPAQQPDSEETSGQRALVLVTGMSGAGRSTALSIFEDLGYESIDNLPIDLLEGLIAGGRRSLALGIDIRTRDFAARPLLAQLDRLLSGTDLRCTLLFLDCDNVVLGRRYTETRRRHPLARGRPVTDGIAAERNLLAPLRGRADLVIDTSALTPAEFRHILAGHFRRRGSDQLNICVTSFAYRGGLPRESDLVFDVRFLRNPHYEPELRALTGRDCAVAQFIAADPRLEPFFKKLTDLLASLLPDYRSEGKTYLTISIGCTGGRHRSVAIATRLAEWLTAQGEVVSLLHRDLEEAHPDRPDGP